MLPTLSPARLRRWPVFVLVVALLLLPLLGAAGPGQDSPTPPAVEPTPVAIDGAPVVVDGQELFRIRTRVGSFTPVERAALISERITQISTNPFVSEVAVQVVDSEAMTDVVVEDEILITVTDQDAEAEGRIRQELAQEWAAAIQTAITQGQNDINSRTLAANIGIVVAIVLGFLLVIWLVNLIGDWLIDKLDPSTDSGRVPRLLQRSEFYQTGQFSRLVRRLLRIFKVVLVIFLLTIAVPLILRSFPRTREFGQRLVNFILAPLAELWDSFVGFLPDLGFLLVLAALTWLATWLVRILFREVERGVIRWPSFEPEWAPFTARIVDFIIIAAAVIIGFTSLPMSQLPVFQGISAFVALLITLASTSAIANIIAGIIITYTGSFRLGDIIQIQTTTGEVMGKYLLTTRIRTFKNEVVSFPNSVILSTSITNFTRIARTTGLTVHTIITIGYNVPWQQVHELLIAAARQTEGIIPNPPPFVLQTSLNDYHISYELNAFTRTPEILPRIYSGLHQNIQDQFNAAGVEIMSPAYSALRDGNEVTLPPEHLPSGYEPSGFRILGTGRNID